MNVNFIIREIRQKINLKEEQLKDEEVLALIEEEVLSMELAFCYSCGEIEALVNRIFCAIRKDLDLLEPFAQDPEVTEIMVNGPQNIFVERRGKLETVEEVFETEEDLEEVIRRIVAKVHREINELNPIVDARLSDGSRVNAVYKNVALGGPILTIRKFPKTGYTMEDLIDFGTITRDCANFLHGLVRAGYNCFISGGTSSGKTTFLNILTNYIPREERIIVIEDSAELQITQIPNIVRMECKNANGEGKGGVSMEDLIKTSLRMRPDRIIVGEVRGREVMDMINAMNTGHDGSLSTGHGNSIEGMLRRLESMFLQAVDFPIEAIRAQIVEGIDIIIHLGRLQDKSRRVLQISEIVGLKDGQICTNELYKYKKGAGLVPTGNHLQNREKLELRGNDDGD
ncbi:MAG: CpaF family protein [Anaerovoracaceae bacterium]